MTFGDLTRDQSNKLAWAEQQLMRGRRPAPVRAAPEEKRPTAGVAAATAPAPATRTITVTEGGREVKRPVALLQLIDHLDKFTVTDDLILAVIEAAEAGMDVETLYADEVKETAARAEEEETPSAPVPEAARPPAGARPMSVYRLAGNTRVYFAENGMPTGPAQELFYVSRIKTPETCFGVELETDALTEPGLPIYRRGDILIFSTNEKVDSGSLAFVKTRTTDELGQVFFDEADEVRLRPLNPAWRERVLKRHEIKALCKLIGHYRTIGQ